MSRLRLKYQLKNQSKQLDKVDPLKLLVLALLVLIAVWLFPLRGKTVELKGRTFHVAVADQANEHQRGLSGRKALRVNEGMLFVFEQEGRHGIWMKDMKFAIDILWLDANKRVVDLEANVSPQSFPHTFAPDLNAHYVLELPAGTLQHLQVAIGDQVDF